jgi:2-polyprenyl-6-methoxyphenol hydroxylase-like FAD-dependent oxidoreductase
LPQHPTIAIIGAGLGGLCLAHGLRAAGCNVTVYERDATASARAQGYRISLDIRGSEALRACIPETLYQLFDATCGQPSTGGAMFTSDGRALQEATTFRFPEEARPGVPAIGRAVDRLILRETLLAGLEDIVFFGKEFAHYELHSPTRVEAHFADGTSIVSDLLVAADGVSSRVRRQFLPQVNLVDVGIRWLGGRTVLDHRQRALLPDAVSDRAVWVKDREQLWFLAPVFFQQKPNEAAAALWPRLHYTDTDDFLMWALIGQSGTFPFTDAQLEGGSETELYGLALQAVRDGDPTLRTLVEGATPERSFALAIRAVPVVDPWPTSPVTFVGDAIHASPVNGTGANAALQDAALLCQYLVRGHTALQQAVDAYAVELLARVRAMQGGLAQMGPRMLPN